MFSSRCKHFTGLLAVMSLWALAPSAGAGGPEDTGALIVHEWGTFLSVQGSDGNTLGGMIDSEEQLPTFVRERSLVGRNRWCWGYKMETPVTYFYVDKPRSVRVRVGMPKGLLTHWYPAVDTFGPPLSATCKSLPGESYLDWGQVELIPDVQAPSVGPPEPMAGLKPAGPQDTWRFARQTDSAFVRQRNKESKVPLWSIATKDGKVYTGTRTRENATELVLQDGAGNTTVILKKAIQERTVVQNGACARVRPEGEADKFLFYRGLGTFELPLKVTHKQLRIGNNLVLENRSNDTLKGVFALQVDKDSIAFAALDDLAGRQRMLAPLGYAGAEPPVFRTKLPLKDGVPQAKTAVATALVKAGLFPKEAQAMVNTWETSYFRTPGLRLLYILPRPIVDDVIPIQIKPAPEQLVRVMVGRVEVLTPETERRIENALANLESAIPAERNKAAEELNHLGRIKDPVLHRIAALAVKPEVRARAEGLLKPLAQQ